MLSKLDPSLQAPLSINLLLINLVIGAIFSLVLKWHYQKFASVLTNKKEFAGVFPFILLITILIITVVKTSLALSLGLVGALSIVRFRTPIKEPEELAYLFMSIAIGLGLGANQTIPTMIAASIILLFMGILKARQNKNEERNFYISFEKVDASKENALEKVVSIISSKSTSVDLRRVDKNDNKYSGVLFIDMDNVNSLESIYKDLEQEFPGINISFIDQSRLPSL